MLRNNKPHTARSLKTTTKDFARFLIAFMNGRDITNKTANEIFTAQINANSRQIFWGLSIGMEIVNMMSAQISVSSGENPDLLAPDGLHPSAEMYSMWVDLIYPHVSSLYR